MNRRTLFAALLVATSLTSLAPCPAAAIPPSYPLKVRGAESLKVWSEPTKTPGLVKLVVVFSFSSRKAGAGLRPGEGSWLDRGRRPGEPNRLEWYVATSDADRIATYLHTGANYYTFECYNTGKGTMQVTAGHTKSVRID
ncbi:MAG TPA: hypothetical protein VGE98_08295 [Thermoanaerobaculia bacterium]